METIVTWGPISIGVTAVIFACHASYRVGVMKGTQNGMAKTLKGIEETMKEGFRNFRLDIIKLFDRFDGLECKERGAEARERDRRIAVVEKKIQELI